MRIVFMGTPTFAAAILEELAQQHEVVAVYTRPDAVRGRGKELMGSPVKIMAEKLELPVYTPRTLRDDQEIAFLRNLSPDVICVAAYGAILTKDVLDLPRFGCLNVHASLLPRWRGAAPIERAILAGDESAGVCIMRMEEGLDTGDYCVSRSLLINDMNSEQLTNELAYLGARALITALAHVEAGEARWVKQDESAVTYAHKIEKGELDLCPQDSASLNARRVQASSSAHAARCAIADRGITVLRAHMVNDLPDDLEVAQGVACFSRKRLFTGCVDGVLEIMELKPDGKKAMDAKSFAAGLPALRGEDVMWGHVNG